MSDEIKRLRDQLARIQTALCDTRPKQAVGEMVEHAITLAAALEAQVSMLRTGDTCARLCEGTAYRIEARQLKKRVAELEAHPPIGDSTGKGDEARELLRAIPTTPEAMIGFIGSHYNSMHAKEWTNEPIPQPAGDLSMVKYSLTVHDLLSAFSWAGFDAAAIASLTNKADGEKDAHVD